jgi:TonB-dependent starch-binding outer membrane protein SusC
MRLFTILTQKLMFTCCILLSAQLLQAQDLSISGKVTDQKNEPVIGAAVAVDGTTKGVSTDLDGNYKLSGLEAKRLVVVVSGIGYKRIRRTIDLSSGQSQTIDFVIEEDALQLDQVVVVGYGLEQKRDVTGSIATIKAKDLNSTLQPSIDQAIQGRASGVQVVSASGVAGAPVKINIRGTNSISAGSEPLYVIDGIPMTTGNFGPPEGQLGLGNNAMADINPNDIESIEILKDAAATSIYGSRGANGVILITTKKGKAGKTKFNFDYSTGIINPTNRLEFLSAQEHLELRDRASIAQNGDPERKDATVGFWNNRPFTRAQADSFAALGGSDWISTAIRRGALHVANLSASGGNDKTTYYIGGSYRNEKGFLVGNDFERMNARFNIDNQANDKLKLGVSSNFAYTINQRVPIGDAGGLGAAQQRLPYIPILNPDGSYNNPYENPAWQLETRNFTGKTVRNISTANAALTILPGLTLSSNFGIDLLNQWESEFNFRNTQDTGSVSTAWDRRTNVFNWSNNNVLQYNYRMNEIHQFGILAGTEVQRSNTRGVGLQGIGFSNDDLREPGNALSLTGYNYATEFSFSSVFSRANYKLKDRYIAEVSFRRDGSSRFGPDNRFGNFWSTSAAWIISEEEFIKNISAISFLKLRSGFGQSGNASIGDFAWRGVYSSTLGYGGNLGIVPSSLENRNLTWEKSDQFDVNLDVAFFKNRVALSATYFNKTSRDLLMYVNIPTSSGFGAVLQNIGKLNNNGWEFNLNTKNIEGKFSWYTDFNISFIRNKVLDAAGLPPDAFESGQPGEGRVIEGYPVGQAFVVKWAGVQKEDGEILLYNADGSARLDGAGNQRTALVKAGTELFYDRYGNIMTWANPTGNFYDNRVAAGNPIPKFMGGITNTFSYAGFDLSILFSFMVGHTIYDDPAKNQIGQWNIIAQRPEILDAWSEENTDGNVPALNGYTSINSDRFLYDASFVRLRSLTFGYTLPKSITDKWKMENVRFFVNGGNLLTWTRYPGWDPEVFRNVDPNSQQGNVSFAGPSLQTPQARTMSLGLRFNF